MLNQLGIEKITIDLPFRLDHVNCFLAEGEEGYMMIDTGLNDKNARAVWKETLKNKKVAKLVLTHLHPDHTGLAGTLQQFTDADVMMSEADAVALDQIWTDEAIPKLLNDYKKADVPEQLIDGIVSILKDFRSAVTPTPNVNHYLEEGERIEIGKEQYEVIFTPGHSDGLVCFFNEDRNVLLSTDHILPKITPNISYWYYGKQNPLQDYEDSLHKIKRLDAEYVIPSHGEPFYDANRRIEEIWAHHLERFEQTLEAIKEPATAFEACESLFKKELSVYDYQFAIGEAIAHLEYLRHKGECDREMEAGKWLYFIK